MRFFNPLAVAFAVDTVISVNRIFLSVTRGRKLRPANEGVHRLRPPDPRLGSPLRLALREGRPAPEGGAALLSHPQGDGDVVPHRRRHRGGEGAGGAVAHGELTKEKMAGLVPAIFVFTRPAAGFTKDTRASAARQQLRFVNLGLEQALCLRIGGALRAQTPLAPPSSEAWRYPRHSRRRGLTRPRPPGLAKNCIRQWPLSDESDNFAHPIYTVIHSVGVPPVFRSRRMARTTKAQRERAEAEEFRAVVAALQNVRHNDWNDWEHDWLRDELRRPPDYIYTDKGACCSRKIAVLRQVIHRVCGLHCSRVGRHRLSVPFRSRRRRTRVCREASRLGCH
jgi:hypothetical protein